MPFTYGILTADGALRAWQRACIKKLDESGLSQLRCIIDAKTNPQERKQREPFDRFARGVPSLAQKPLRDLMVEYPEAISLEVSGSNFAPTQIRALQTAALDFVLCFDPRQLGLEISALPKFGVWVFSNGDMTNFESPIAGFWELYYDYDVTGAALVALSSADVTGVVLKAGYLRTLRTSFERNADFVAERVGNVASARVSRTEPRTRLVLFRRAPAESACDLRIPKRRTMSVGSLARKQEPRQATVPAALLFA